MNPTEKIDAALDSVFKAGGLWDSVKPDFIERMREAMRKIMADSYISGKIAAWDEMRKITVLTTNDAHDAMKGK